MGHAPCLRNGICLQADMRTVSEGLQRSHLNKFLHQPLFVLRIQQFECAAFLGKE